MGLVCTNIEWILEYQPKRVFDWFEDEVIKERRMEDLDPDWVICGESAKTDENCAYGCCVIDKSKHNSVRFVEEENLGIHIQNPLFKTIDELEGSVYEIVKGRKKVVLDTPIGIAVYSYAKLCLINFWEFLNKYLVYDMYQDRHRLSLCCTST